MGTLIIGIFIIRQGLDVIANPDRLASFLSIISALKQMSKEFIKTYQLKTRITSAGESVAQVARFMNLPTDGEKRLHNHTDRLAYGHQLTKHQYEVLDEQNLDVSDVLDPGIQLEDSLPIKIVHLAITHEELSRVQAAVLLQAQARGRKGRDQVRGTSKLQQPGNTAKQSMTENCEAVDEACSISPGSKAGDGEFNLARLPASPPVMHTNSEPKDHGRCSLGLQLSQGDSKGVSRADSKGVSCGEGKGVPRRDTKDMPRELVNTTADYYHDEEKASVGKLRRNL